MRQWNKIYRRDPRAYTYYSLLEPHRDLARVARRFTKGGRVLDLGCGSGRNLLSLTKKGFRVSGIDIAPAGIRRIRAAGVTTAVVGDIYRRLPYDDDAFDAIISVQVLQHASASKIKHAIREIFRVLRPGGLVFVTVCGRISNGQVRYCLVKTARKVAPHTYVPTKGDERGLTHFIYNKRLLLEQFKAFETLELWKDDKDYYCLLARKPR